MLIMKTAPKAAEAIERLEKELANLKEEQSSLNAQWEVEKNGLEGLKKIKEEMEQVSIDLQQAERDYDFTLAAELKYGTLAVLQKKLDAFEQHLTDKPTSMKPLLRNQVTEDDIADVISKWTGIPITKLIASEMDKLLNLENELHDRVIGQNEAVQAVADSILRSDRKSVV